MKVIIIQFLKSPNFKPLRICHFFLFIFPSTYFFFSSGTYLLKKELFEFTVSHANFPDMVKSKNPALSHACLLFPIQN